MIKILVWAKWLQKKMIWPKTTLLDPSIGHKVKSDFSVYFSIEKSNLKKIFCFINLVYWQVYRVEKVGIYLLNLSKKTIFKFFVTKKLMIAQKKIHAPGMMSDQFGIGFKMFPIVELTKLGGQNFKLGLYSGNFWPWKWKVNWNRYFKTL